MYSYGHASLTIFMKKVPGKKGARLSSGYVVIIESLWSNNLDLGQGYSRL